MDPGQGAPMLLLTKSVECLDPGTSFYLKESHPAFNRSEDGGLSLSLAATL